MTLDALMESIKSVYMRAATGPLRDRGWRVIGERVRRELQSYLRSNPNMERIDYACHAMVDDNGGAEMNGRTIEEARVAWMRRIERGRRPDEVLEVSLTVRRLGSGRPVVNVTARRRNDMLLAIGRASSDETPGRARAEGSRATVREGSDTARLAELSGGMRSTLGARTASAQLPEDAPSGAGASR